jgi:hypothetical protein
MHKSVGGCAISIYSPQTLCLECVKSGAQAESIEVLFAVCIRFTKRMKGFGITQNETALAQYMIAATCASVS